MTLFSAYIALGIPLTLLGFFLASGSTFFGNALRTFPRSRIATIVLWAGGAAWFVMQITRMSESDLAGFPRGLLISLFVCTALGAVVFLRDLLAVRGLAVLLLLSARELLDAGYMQQPRNLPLSSLTYVLIVLGIWWGASPYVFRNWLFWTLDKRTRTLAAGALISLAGLVCLATAFFSAPTPAA